jgi:hypothetical protein
LRETGGAAATTAYTWARQRKDSSALDQSVLTNTAPSVTFNDYQDNDPATFAGIGNNIRVLQDGLYSLLVRLFWGSFGVGPTDLKAEVYFSGIDDGNYAAYNGASVFTDFNGVTTGQLIVRLAANQTLSVQARQQSTKTWLLSSGTFFEAVRLGSVNTDDRGF